MATSFVDDSDKINLQFSILNEKLDKGIKNFETEQQEISDDVKEALRSIEILEREQDELDKIMLEYDLEYEQLSIDCDQARKIGEKSIKRANEIKLKVEPSIQMSKDLAASCLICESDFQTENRKSELLREEIKNYANLMEDICAISVEEKLQLPLDECAAFESSRKEREVLFKAETETQEMEVNELMSELLILTEQINECESRVVNNEKELEEKSIFKAEVDMFLQKFEDHLNVISTLRDQIKQNKEENDLKQAKYEEYRKEKFEELDERTKSMNQKIETLTAKKLVFEQRELQYRTWREAIIQNKAEKASKEANALRNRKSPRKSSSIVEHLVNDNTQVEAVRKRVTFQEPLRSSYNENVKPPEKSKSNAKSKKRKAVDDSDLDWLNGGSFMSFN